MTGVVVADEVGMRADVIEEVMDDDIPADVEGIRVDPTVARDVADPESPVAAVVLGMVELGTENSTSLCPATKGNAASRIAASIMTDCCQPWDGSLL